MVEDFDFYPHTCVIFHGAVEDPVTGESVPKEIYTGECYLQQGATNLKGEWLQGQDTVFIPDESLNVSTGDGIKVTMENGTVYEAIVKQAYPIKDPDFGGQDLKVYQQDAVKQ